MTETKFTKGPWDVRCDPCHYDSATDVVSVNSDKLHACVGGKANWAEAEANARLIAAAPDMYEALENVQKLISEGAVEGFNPHAGDWADRLYFSQQMTSTALSKARGES